MRVPAKFAYRQPFVEIAGKAHVQFATPIAFPPHCSKAWSAMNIASASERATRPFAQPPRIRVLRSWAQASGPRGINGSQRREKMARSH
jgi:hypothetical protein